VIGTELERAGAVELGAPALRDEEAPHGAPALRSAIYEGAVVHRRPGADGHRFRQEVVMAFVDLGEVEQLCDLHPCWSARWPAPVWWRRRDFLGDPAVPLDRAVADLVEAETGTRPAGPIAVLTNPRTWGWSFNPISCYFCYSEDGNEVSAMVAEVTNTPWGERHCYVMGGPGDHVLDKALHVSPFLPMEMSYRTRFSAPGPELSVSFEVIRAGTTQLYAGMRLRRQPADRSSLGRLPRSPRRGSIGVSAGIYRQALALRAGGAEFHRHPGRARVPAAFERDKENRD